MRNAFQSIVALGFFLVTSLARAGHYQAGPTSGLVATASPGGVVGPTYGNGSCSVPSAGGGNGTGTIGGTLSTTFTWIRDKDSSGNDLPGDNPPTSVLVTESCSVFTDAKAYPYPSSPLAKADNGLDTRFCTTTKTPYTINQSIPVPPYGYPIGSGCSASSTGTAYRIVSGGNTVTVTCSPTGTCSTSSGPFSFTFSYSASISPIEVFVQGSIGDTSGYNSILIGQHAKGYLVGSCSFSNWQWSCAGSKFKSWDVSPSQAKAEVINVPASEWSKEHPEWYWLSDQNGLSVSCTADASVNNISIGSVSVSENVNVWPPYYYFANESSTSSSMSGSTLTSADLYLLKPGQYFAGKVGTPALFSAQGTGNWEFVQIASPSRTHTLQSGSVLHDWPLGLTGLDNVCPYPAPPGEPAPAWSAEIATSTSLATLHWTQDSPDTNIAATEVSYSVGDQFEMHLIYCPPGGDSQWVPIHKLDWAWICSDSRATPSIPWTTPPPGSVYGISSVRNTSHPTWILKFTNGGGVVYGP